MRRVMLTEAARKLGVTSSTFVYNNIQYKIAAGGDSEGVSQEVAAAWNAADTNTTTQVER